MCIQRSHSLLCEQLTPVSTTYGIPDIALCQSTTFRLRPVGCRIAAPRIRALARSMHAPGARRTDTDVDSLCRTIAPLCVLAAAAIALIATPVSAVSEHAATRNLLNATPAADEGDDGVLEGGGEGEGTGVPAADEGDDGVLEGGGEGEGTAVPAANEGDDGVLEGGGEGEGTAVPAADEGEDGVLEGGGEGAGTPAANEGDDGVFEGGGEGEGAATNATVEGTSSAGGMMFASLAAASAAATAMLVL